MWLTIKTLQETEVLINTNYIQFIQSNGKMGYVIVFASGAAHNVSNETVEKIREKLFPPSYWKGEKI